MSWCDFHNNRYYGNHIRCALCRLKAGTVRNAKYEFNAEPTLAVYTSSVYGIGELNTPQVTYVIDDLAVSWASEIIEDL